MYKFKSISLKNWKNFREAHVDFTDRMFVVGANAAGKSNLLDAFRFLKDLTSNGLIKAVNSRGGLSKIRNLNARQPSYVEIVVKLVNSDDNDDIWEYQLRFNTADGNKSDVNISVERVVHNNMEIKHRRYKDPEEDYSTRQFTHLEQPAANKDFRVLFDTFQNISYVNIIPQLVRDTGVVVPSVAKDDYYGSSLLTRVSETAKRTRDSRLKKISAVLRLAVPQFSGLEYV
ncbi:MAG: AAA family ATPase, partial [Bacillota bacterium]